MPKHANVLALILVLVAELGQQRLSNSIVAFLESPFLSGQWVIVYVHILFLLLLLRNNGWKIFQSYKGGIKSSSSARLIEEASETISRIQTTISHSSMRLFSLAGSLQNSEGELRPRAISADVPFVPLEEIKEMALRDVKDIFRYVRECNRPGFDKAKFLEHVRPVTCKAIEAIHSVTLESRGQNVEMSSGPADSSGYELDALSFAAAARIFAEWRRLRLVPPGYPHYAVAMNLARRDLLQNISKIEVAAHSYINNRARNTGTDTNRSKENSIASPTIRQLLGYEVSQNMHPRLPRLAEKSGASGLLWTKRQIDYHSLIILNLSKIPVAFPSAEAAVKAAYLQVYENYHGFIVKQIFLSSFKAIPPPDVVLNFMDLPLVKVEEERISETECSSKEDDNVGLSFDEDDDDEWVNFPVENNSPIDIQVVSQASSPNLVERFGEHLANEWRNFHSFIGQCRGSNSEHHPSKNAIYVNATSLQSLLSLASVSKTAHCDNHAYRTVTASLVQDLDSLISVFNMNDPSKA